jgi:hypothetical protein
MLRDGAGDGRMTKCPHTHAIGGAEIRSVVNIRTVSPVAFDIVGPDSYTIKGAESSGFNT